VVHEVRQVKILCGCCRYGGIIPAGTSEAAQAAVAELNGRVGPLVQQYVAALEKIKLKEGIRLVMTISAAGNKFFQVYTSPSTYNSSNNVKGSHVRHASC
jgi:hypothetical protein